MSGLVPPFWALTIFRSGPTPSPSITSEQQVLLDKGIVPPAHGFGECLMGDAHRVGEIVQRYLVRDLELALFTGADQRLALVSSEIGAEGPASCPRSCHRVPGSWRS